MHLRYNADCVDSVVTGVKANITPRVLSWARETSGYSLQDAAARLRRARITDETVAAWERGEGQPTYVQLEELAVYYKRPVAVFFFPEPPEEASVSQRLRSLPEEVAQSLSPKIRYLVRLATAMQINLDELHDGDSPAALQKFRQQVGRPSLRNPQGLASRVRAIMGVSLPEQLAWSSSDDALVRWRDAVEKLGIWVFKKAFQDRNSAGDDRYCGFCLADKRFPVIYINSSMAKQRQAFTLFHELAHVIIGKGGVDFREGMEESLAGRHRSEEVFCNAFAGAFLVPDANVWDMDDSPSDRQIRDLARKYKVSREVILRRHLELGRTTRDFYNERREQWQQQRRQEQAAEVSNESGPNYYVVQRAHLSDKYLKRVFARYRSQQINEYQLADYLKMKIDQAEILEGYL